MKNYLVVAIASLVIAGCQPKEASKTIVSGKVLSGGKTVYFKNMSGSSVDFSGKTYEAEVDENGNFSIELPVKNMTSGYIQAGNFYHNLSIKPDDNIFITINGDSVTYTGTGSNKNSFNSLVNKNNLSVNVVYSGLYREKHTPESFSMLLNKFRFQRDSLLSSFNENALIDSSFIKSYNTETQVMYNYGLYRFPFIYSEQSGKDLEDIELSEAYMQFRSIHDLATR